MLFWSVDKFDLADSLNDEIWRLSPARGSELKRRLRLNLCGGLQEISPGRNSEPLPWVPDLVGRRSHGARGILVVGSAYAPFIRPWARRSAYIDPLDYRSAKDAGEFLRKFISAVVVGDPAYYDPLAQLLSGIAPADYVLLTDLCRASFVRLDGTRALAGDAVVKSAPEVYAAYVRAGEDWTWQRIQQCAGRLIVTLGAVAEHALLEIFRRRGYVLSIPAAPHVSYAAVEPGATGSITRPMTSGRERLRSGWWWRAGRGASHYHLAAVIHPSYRNVHDPGFENSRALIIAARNALPHRRAAKL